MPKYLFAFDIGSSAIKNIVMKIDNEDVTNVLTKTFEFDDVNFLQKQIEDIIIDFLKEKNISIKEVEAVIMTGARSSFFDKSILEIPIYFVREFDAIGVGAGLLSKMYDCYIVNIGTGTAIVKTNISDTQYLFGTALGGGTFLGLSKLMNIKYDDIDDLYDKASFGTYKNVDLLIKDISKDNIGVLNSQVSSSNFGGLYKKHSENDLLNAILNMIIQNIGLIAKQVIDNDNKNLPIVFCGTMIKYKVVKELLFEISSFTNKKYIFIDDKLTEYAVVIGAYEKYMLTMRGVYENN